MPDPLEVLDRINSFYATAWSQLLAYTAVLVGVVGGGGARGI